MRIFLTFILCGLFSAVSYSQAKVDTFQTYYLSVMTIGMGEDVDYRIDDKSVNKKQYKKTLAKVNKANAITRKGKVYYNRLTDLKGNKISEGKCFNECMLGYHRTYHLNGKVESEGFYLEPDFEYSTLPDSYCSKREGLWKFYDNTGKVIRETTYDKGKITANKIND